MKTKVTTTTNESTPGWNLQDDISGLSELAIRKRAIELNKKRKEFKKTKMTAKWQNIADAVAHYQKLGYLYTEVPWIVDELFSCFTCSEPEKIVYTQDETTLIGSAEQSFFMEVFKGTLKVNQLYTTVSPCFRPRDNDSSTYHYPQFHKVELGAYAQCPPAANSLLESIKEDALAFFASFIDKNEIFFKKEDIKLVSISSYEIETLNNLDFYYKDIEIGSYGIRKITSKRTESTYFWVFGTGLAEPRFSELLKSTNKGGYHSCAIKKGTYGDSSKVLEELREFEEALLSGNQIMALCELSDLLGSVEGLINSYLTKKNLRITYSDIVKMKDLTKQAFANGRRK